MSIPKHLRKDTHQLNRLHCLQMYSGVHMTTIYVYYNNNEETLLC